MNAQITNLVLPKSVTLISSQAFSGSINRVFYEGTEEEWNEIDIKAYNYALDNTKYFYSEAEPTTDGNYWHYVNGEIVIWE